MNIQNLNQYPTFKACRYRDIKISSMRNLSELTCACCGRPMLSQEKINNAIMDLEKPFAKFIEIISQKIRLNSDVLLYLQELAQKEPQKSFDNIINSDPQIKQTILSLIPRASRGHQLSRIVDISKSEMKNSLAVIHRLNPLREYLRKDDLEIFEQFEIYAQKYPRKTLSEIVNLDEVYEFHKSKYLLNRAEFTAKRNLQCQNVKDIVKNYNTEALKELDLLYAKVIGLSTYTRDEKQIRYTIKNLFSEFISKYNLEKCQNQIFAELEQIPVEQERNKDKFFVHAHDKKFNDFKIIYEFLSPCSMTFEHLKPHSENGATKIENGILLCQKCNQARNTIDYSTFIDYHPEMTYNVQKQLCELIDLILNGTLNEDFETYPIQIAKTLSSISENKINIDISNYREQLERKNNLRLRKQEEKIESLNVQKESIQTKISSLLKELTELVQERTIIENQLEDEYIKQDYSYNIENMLKQ